MELKDWKDNDGKFIAFAWPGGYPVAYLAEDGDTFCPDCANGENGSDATTVDDGSRSGWLVIGGFIHYEGPPEICAHCDAEVASAYGDPEETTETGA